MGTLSSLHICLVTSISVSGSDHLNLDPKSDRNSFYSGKMVNLNAIKKPLAAFGLGEACPGYNPKVHGPYDPSVYYGKRDTPLAQVKLGELPGWLARRSKNPIDWSRAVARAWWRWQCNYIQPKRAGFAGVAQFFVAVPVFFYILNFEKLSHH